MRITLKKILVHILYFSGINFLYSLFVGKKIFVFAHHSVSGNKDDNLEEILYPNLSIDVFVLHKRLEYLKKRGHTFITLSELDRLDSENIKKPTIIYFDDGFRDILENAIPVLKEFGIPATIFVSPDLSDKKDFLWTMKHRLYLSERQSDKEEIETEIADLKKLSDKQRIAYLEGLYKDNNFAFTPKSFNLFLHWEDIKFLANHGFEIGSHSMSHKKLTECDGAELDYEIKESKKVIEEKIGKSVKSFSYPYGRRNALVDQVIREAGYKFVVSAGIGLDGKEVGNGTTAFLKNVQIGINDNIIDFKVKIYSWNLFK